MSGKNLSAATQALITALDYDRDHGTVSLSPTNPALAWASDSLNAAFGDDTVVLDEVVIVDPPPVGSAETLALTGKAAVLNDKKEPAYLEITLIAGNPHTLLLLVGQPSSWNLTKGFPSLPSDLSPLRLESATVAVSHGLSGVSGKRSVGQKEIELSGFDFRDGLQILFDRVVNAKFLHPESERNEARQAGIPAEDLAFWDNVRDRAQVQIDRTSNRLRFESWWDRKPTNPDGRVDEVGHAVIFDLTTGAESSPQTHRWMRRLGAPAAPIVIETDIVPGYRARYTARLDRGAPLGQTEAALEALLPQTVELPKPPETLSLVAFTYAPDGGHYLTVAAGSRDDGGEHVVDLGPAELREVRYTVAVVDRANGQTPVASVEIEGLVALFGVLFDVKGQFENYIQGGLVDPAGVHLGKFIAGVLPTGLPFGLDSVTLCSAWVHHSLEKPPGPTRLEVSLDGHVELVPTKAIVLDEVDLAIELSGGKPSSGQIGAVLTLGPVSLRVQATEEDGAWSFYGTLSSDDGISFKELVDHLVHAWGASVPNAVPDVKLTMLALSFQTATRALGIQAEVEWEVDDDVPVLSGKNSALLDFTVARDRGQGGHSMTAEARWTLAKPNTGDSKYILDAHTRLSGEEQSFGFDLSASGSALKFSDVSSGIGLDKHIPGFATTVLDELLQVSTLSFDYARPGGHLDLAWTRPLGRGLLLSEYHKNGEDKKIEVSWNPNPPPDGNGTDEKWEPPTIGVQDLASLVGLESVLSPIEKLPGCKLVTDILTFSQLGFSWSADGANEALSVTAQSISEAFGSAFFYLPCGEQDGGFVAGVAFNDGKCLPSQLVEQLDDGLSGVSTFLEKVEEVVEVVLTHVIFSTVANRNLQPPSFAANTMRPSHDATPATPPSSPFGTAPMLLSEGLSIGARVKFGENKTVRRVIDINELDGQVTVGKVCAVQVSIPGSLTLKAGDGNQLALTAPVLRIKENLDAPEAGPEFNIQGGLDLQLFGQKLSLLGWIALAEEAITGHITVSNLPFPIPIYSLPGVLVEAPLSFEVGLQFEPAGLDLGLSCSFGIYKNDHEKTPGKATFVLEMVEEIPQPLYVEFALEEMSLPVLLEAKTGVQAALHLVDEVAKVVGAGSDEVEAVEAAIGHVESILSKVELQDVRLHWADSIVPLPDGTTAMPGVGFRGALKIFDWKAFAMVDLSAQGIPGLTGHFEAQVIEIADVVRIWGDGKGLHKAPKKAEDVDEAMKGDEKDEGDWFLKPGGPILHLSTHSSPFLHADLHAELFGFLHTDIHADITEKGFDFDFKIGAGNAVTAELECHWWHDDGRLEAHGDLGMHLHGDIGPLIPGVDATKFRIDSDLDAHVSLLVDSKDFKLTVHGSFGFEGSTLHLPELVIDVKFSSLEDLAKAIWDHLVDKAKDIFEELLLPIGKFLEDGAKEVAKKAEDAAKAVAHSAKAAAEEAEKVVSAVGEVLVDEVKKAAEAVLDEAGKVAASAESHAEVAAQAILEKAGELSGKAAELTEHAAETVKAIVADAVAIVGEAAHYALEVAAKAAQWTAEQLDNARRWVSARLDQAKALVSQLGREAEEAVKAIEKEISAIEDEIEQLLSRAAHEAEDLVSGGAHAVVHFFGW